MSFFWPKTRARGDERAAIGDGASIENPRDGKRGESRTGGVIQTVARGVGRVLNFSAVVLLAAICLAAGVAGWGSATGKFHITTILSGSMERELPTGSAVILSPKPAGQVEVGDIIAFVPPGRTETTVHRVIEVVSLDPKPVVITKGDENEVADPWNPLRIEEPQVWTARYAIPGVGRWFLWLQSTPNRLILAGAVAILLWLRIAWVLGTREPGDGAASTGPSDTEPSDTEPSDAGPSDAELVSVDDLPVDGLRAAGADDVGDASLGGATSVMGEPEERR